MKKIFHFAIVIVILNTTNMGCNDDYLEKYPLDQISDASFWNTALDIELYANQFYPDLKNPDWQYRPDDQSDNQGPSNRNLYLWGESIVPNNGGGWSKSDWQGIRRCNYALDRISSMEKTDEVLKFESEIRFFKSHYYFEKLKTFGDIPWLDHELQTDSEELYGERDSRKTIISNILSDLNFAIANLPETSNEDRLTRYAALALKANICLFEGTFRKYHDLGDFENILRESVNASEIIMNSGLFSVYNTGNPDNDYFDLFIQFDLHGNPENIFSQYYIDAVHMHNNVHTMKDQETGFTKDFVESYLCSDGLPISLSPLYQGDAEFHDEFVNRDPRMTQSIYTEDRPLIITFSGDSIYQPMPLFHNRQCYTGYYIIKFWSPYEEHQQQWKSTTDDFIFRYGELLVGYAEAKAELDECTQNVLDMSINLLRDRVGMPHMSVEIGFVDPNWPDWGYQLSPLLNEIRRERRIELCAEGKRWWDLVRWKAGKLIENPKTILGARDPATNNYRILYPQFKNRTWYDRLYLSPIPIQEITLNPNIVQNPGWEEMY